jgi:hypothetical protein
MQPVPAVQYDTLTREGGSRRRRRLAMGTRQRKEWLVSTKINFNFIFSGLSYFTTYLGYKYNLYLPGGQTICIARRRTPIEKNTNHLKPSLHFDSDGVSLFLADGNYCIQNDGNLSMNPLRKLEHVPQST